jgi:hypothetical protein
MRMKKIVILILITLPFLDSFGQENKEIIGTWIIEKTKFENQELIGNADADTLRFTANTFEQKIILLDEKKEKFLWTHSGKYKVYGKAIILSNRISSTGESGKEYPEIKIKYKIKIGKLILIQTNKLNDTFWYYYKKID